MLSTSDGFLLQFIFFLAGGLGFVLVALFVSRLIRPDRPSAQKQMPYESGEMPQGPAWVQFNLRFYVLALVFILFEVEVVFMFPWAVVFGDAQLHEQTSGSWGWLAFGEMLIFILILFLGLIYAWKQGHLDWVKSKPAVRDVNSPVPADKYEAINEKYKRRS
ncbi:MAG TPA: NADH-quinone oxidoreductase subunit A [Cytophagales bacterium]|nr:NADH-quinone oxidoreductase subunit A [Cytophagales bacterium]HRG08282.1 NADH-quinone oxidoreductase subunit A [Cyclobacteriaceae bacterium]